MGNLKNFSLVLLYEFVKAIMKTTLVRFYINRQI